jgi:hypothetical protein
MRCNYACALGKVPIGGTWVACPRVGKSVFPGIPDLYLPLNRASTLDTNFGVWPFTICRMLGPNSWKTFMPASPPAVEPKLLKVAKVDRAKLGRDAE